MKNKPQNSDICSNIIENFCLNSQIVKKHVDAEYLLKFFPKEIKQVKLLFKASDHQFSIDKYMQKCGRETNTLVICQTMAGKIIGGYSPISHEWQEEEQNSLADDFMQDQSNTSFLFSLTNMDKFELNIEEEAVKRLNKKQGICFGDLELYICDHSDKIEASSIAFNFSYYNKRYQTNSVEQLHQCFLKMIGNESASFLTKEWEVWKVYFD